MKKLYTKPFIAVESFQLNAAIAGACFKEGKTPLGHDEHKCTPAEEQVNPIMIGLACFEIDLIDAVSGKGNPDGICYQALEFSVTENFLES